MGKSHDLVKVMYVVLVKSDWSIAFSGIHIQYSFPLSALMSGAFKNKILQKLSFL